MTIPKRIRDELGLTAGTQIEFTIEEDGTLRVQQKEPPRQRLQQIKAQLADHDIDVTQLRRDAKTAWSSHLDGDES